MVTTSSGSTSLKEYLKKYENTDNVEKKRKKKKPKTVATGVLVVDEDPVWQKPVNLEEEEDDEPDVAPQVEEDIDVKYMKRLELVKAKRLRNQGSEDGSGWVSVSDTPKSSTSDISPPRNRRARNDTPSPEAGRKSLDSIKEETDLSPPRQNRRRNDSPSPPPGVKREIPDLSPPRKNRRRNDSPSPPPRGERESPDLSPPQRNRRVNDSPSSQGVTKTLKDSTVDLSPPRKRGRRYDAPSPEPNIKTSDAGYNSDLSPPRRRGRSQIAPSPLPARKSLVSGANDLSSPRRRNPPKFSDSRESEDLSPPRKNRKGIDKMSTHDSSSQQRSTEADLSPPRKSKVEKKTGLITGKEVREEIAKIKKDEWERFNEMDASASGRGAEPVYRIKGVRVSKDEYLKLTKKQEKPKEKKKLEWGKGLAQKREAEANLLEMEREKAKPFARSRDDPELDRMFKDRLRWGDPMAHLVKRKQSEVVLPDIGNSEKMKESGFIVPQDIPSHSWIKRGLDFEPNRYGIKPGRHWDGVNRSTGYEQQLFKRTNEKRATDREAYLWSVSDM